MAFEKQFTAKQAAFSVLEKVTELLQKSELHKKYEGFKAVEESARKSGASDPAAVAAAVGRKKYGKEAFQAAAAKGKKMGKAEGSDGHYSMDADPGEPKAGKGSKPGKCPECGHPSPASGQGDSLPRSKAQEDWMEKDEDMDKHGLSPEQMKAKLAKHGLSPAEMKANMAKYEDSNSKKMGYKLPEAGKEERSPEASDNSFKVKGRAPKSSESEHRVSEQKDPQHNPAENKEGNNELAGTTPTQVGQEGKNMPGYDEMKSHLKLAKFIGRMDYKRQSKHSASQAQSAGEAQHKESISDKND